MPSALDLLKFHPLPEPEIPALPPAPPITPRPARPVILPDNVLDRARKYIERMPPAIEGQNGSGATLAVARVLLNEFALSRDDALELLHEYNFRCQPPWSDKELIHKLESAQKKIESGDCHAPKGHLLQEPTPGSEVRYRAKAAPVQTSPKTKDSDCLDIDALLDFKAEFDPSSIMGSRWLCEGSTMVLVGQSGLGKSTLVAQWAVTVLLGKPFFGIKTRGELKCLLVQSENDDGDIATMLQGVIHGMGLDKNSPELRYKLREKLKIIRESSKTSHEFIAWMDPILERHKPDLVFADPLLAYLGGDINKQDVCARFLRNGLLPMVQHHKCAWVWCHHTGKPPKDTKNSTWTDSDCMYMGTGSSDIPNSARSTAMIKEIDEDEHVFKFTINKRYKQAEMLDLDGQPARSIYLRHSRQKDVLHWEQCPWTEERPQKVRYNAVKKSDEDRHHQEILERLKMPQKYGDVIKIIRTLAGCGDNKARAHMQELLKKGLVKSGDTIPLYSWGG